MPTTRLTVLVEGVSDVAALEVLFGELPGVALVAMGGATNIGRYVRETTTEIAGLCDAPERRFFERALGTTDLAARGFFVCDPDLEHEFIRALGIRGVEEVIDEQGDLAVLRTFQNQPFQRDRDAVDQLHRFFGTTAGRKEKYGRALALALDELPPPLAALKARVASIHE